MKHFTGSISLILFTLLVFASSAKTEIPENMKLEHRWFFSSKISICYSEVTRKFPDQYEKLFAEGINQREQSEFLKKLNRELIDCLNYKWEYDLASPVKTAILLSTRNRELLSDSVNAEIRLHISDSLIRNFESSAIECGITQREINTLFIDYADYSLSEPIDTEPVFWNLMYECLNKKFNTTVYEVADKLEYLYKPRNSHIRKLRDPVPQLF